MNPGELNDVSAAIGRLQAFVEDLREDIKVSQETQNRLASVMSELSSQVSHLCKEIKLISPITEDYKKTKNRALGFIFAISVFASVVGFAISEIKSYFMFHFFASTPH